MDRSSNNNNDRADRRKSGNSTLASRSSRGERYSSASPRSGSRTRRRSVDGRRPNEGRRRSYDDRTRRDRELVQAIELQRVENEQKDREHPPGSPLIGGNSAIPGDGEDGEEAKDETTIGSKYGDGNREDVEDGADMLSPASLAAKTQNDILSFVSKEKEKKAFFREVARHILFTAIFIAILFLQRNVFYSFLMNDALNTAFISQQIDSSLQPFAKTFLDVGEWGELRDWMVGVLAEELDTNQFYSGAPYTNETDFAYIENANRLIGGVRLRQLRVAPQTCWVDGMPQTCYNDLSNISTAPFGPPDNPTKYQYQQPDQCVSQRLIGNQLGTLDGEGFIVDIPLYSNFTERIQELITDGWWDMSTRAIIITMNFLNIHLDSHVSVLYLIVEMPAGGIVYPSYEMKTFRPHLYVTDIDKFRFFLEICFIILLGYSFFAELSQVYEAVRKRGLKGYLRSGWNILEIVNIVLFFITIGMYIDSYAEATKLQYNLPRINYQCDLEDLAALALNFYNINAANIILTVFHTFKYLQLNKRLYVLWKTLQHAGTDLLGFFFIFFVCTVGFLFMGWITFGPDTTLFNTFGNAFASCWNFVIGNAPDYGTLSASNRLLGPAFFTLFTIFIFFILANMFVAILIDSFEEVHASAKKKSLRITDEIEKTLLSLVSKVKLLVVPKGQKPKRITEILKNMQNPGILQKEDATVEDIRSAIGKDATDADARVLKDWNDKMRLKSKHKAETDADSDDPEFSDDYYEDESEDEAPAPSGPSLHSAEIEQMQATLAQMQVQMKMMQEGIEMLLASNKQ